MKKVKIENVWPHDVIQTEFGIGQVVSVWNEKDSSPPAVVEFSWHQKGYSYAYFDWNEEVVVLSEKDLLSMQG